MSPFDGFGPALRALRERAGLSQAEVEARSGLKSPSLHRYEAGKALPKLATLDATLSALEMDALDLALELYRQQAASRARARGSFERGDLLASPMGRQILDHARMLYHLGTFWIEAALALLPAARPAGPVGEHASEQPEPAGEEAPLEATADAGAR